MDAQRKAAEAVSTLCTRMAAGALRASGAGGGWALAARARAASISSMLTRALVAWLTCLGAIPGPTSHGKGADH